MNESYLNRRIPTIFNRPESLVDGGKQMAFQIFADSSFMMSSKYRNGKADDKPMNEISLRLLTQQLAFNLPAGTTIHVTNYGAAWADDLVPCVRAHAECLGEDTIHICVLVWSGNDFTSSAYKPRRGKQRARKFDENLTRV